MKPINTSIYERAFGNLLRRYDNSQFSPDSVVKTGKTIYVGVNYDPAARTIDTVRTEVAVG